MRLLHRLSIAVAAILCGSGISAVSDGEHLRLFVPASILLAVVTAWLLLLTPWVEKYVARRSDRKALTVRFRG